MQTKVSHKLQTNVSEEFISVTVHYNQISSENQKYLSK